MNLKRILICLLALILVPVTFGCDRRETALTMHLRGDREIYIECFGAYTEPGAVAQFGEERPKVQISGDAVDTNKLGSYLLKYTAKVKDRLVTDYRVVHVVDSKVPEIKLVGAEYFTMSEGQPYPELGCIATDNYDGDLSDKVVVSGNVDCHIPGKYTLTYTVTDSFGNQAAVDRFVSVEPWEASGIDAPQYGQPNGKVIYLTFDDGPSQHTPRLLDVLKQYNVKATFFVVNTKFVDTIKRIAAEGHTLAMHTTSHVYKEIYASEEAYFKDLYGIQGVIKDLTGQESKFLRFPGGSSNRSSSFNPGIMTRLTKLVEEKGFTYFDWTLDSKDTGGSKTPAAVYSNVISGISKEEKGYSIVLQHDIKEYSVDAVESIIRWGLANGYTFLPIDENTPVYHHTLRN